MKQVTLSDLLKEDEADLRMYAKLMNLPLPHELSKRQIAEAILGKKCFGCGTIKTK